MSSYSKAPPAASIYSGVSSHLKTEIVNVTPDMAKTLRADAHFDRQRPIDAANVARLALEMTRGWFLAGTPVFICVLPDGSMRVVNGNHTLEAIMASGVTVPLTVIYAAVAGIEAVARAYANLDIQKIRSWQNALQAFKGDATGFEGKALSALGIVAAGFGAVASAPLAKSRTERFSMLEEYKTAASIIDGSMAGAPAETKRLILRAPILAVALYVTRHHPSSACEFFGGAAWDNGLSSNDPRKVLLRFVRNSKFIGSSGQQTQVKAAALSWNAFFEKREIDHIKPGAVTELKIAGTAWHKGDPGKSASQTKPMFEVGTRLTSSGQTQAVRFVG